MTPLAPLEASPASLLSLFWGLGFVGGLGLGLLTWALVSGFYGGVTGIVSSLVGNGND